MPGYGGDRQAFGSPVKDPQATKVFAETRNLAFSYIYRITSRLKMNCTRLLNQMGQFMKSEAGAAEVASQVLDACP